MADKNPNQIDINLSLLSGQSGAHFEKFVSELSKVSKSLDRISRMSFPGTAQTEMDFSGQGGPSSGSGPLQQRQAEKLQQKSQGGSSGQKATETVLANQNILRRAAQLTRRALGSYEAPVFRESHPNDQDFVAGRGGHRPPGGGGPTLPPDASDDDRDLFNLQHWGNEQVELPRFGALTVQDKIGFMRNLLSRMAMSDDGTSVESPRMKNWATKLDKAHSLYPYLETAVRSGEWMRGQTYGRAQGMQTYGTSLGYQRNSGYDVSPGPFGFQLPFSQFFEPGGKVALNDTVHKAYIAAQAGINSGQVGEIYGNLQGRGYVNGDARDKMLQSMTELVKRNPGMDINQLGGMQDEATRFGGESLKEFNDQMNALPDIAHAANVSLGEMMAHMDEIGKTFTTQFGATYGQGINFGMNFTTATGMPAPIGAKLLENPFVQSQIMSQTGMLPQQMGNAGSSTLVGASINAVKQMMGMYKGMKGRDWTDKYGATHHVSGQREAEAMVAAQMGIPVDRVHQMLTHGDQMQSASEIKSLTESRDAYIRHIQGRKDLTQAQKDSAINSAMKDHNHQAMMKAMGSSGFTAKEQTAIKNAGKLGHWQEMPSWAHAKNNRLWVPDNAADAEKRQSALIEKTLHSHEAKLADRNQGPKDKVTIDLTKEARALLRVVGISPGGGVLKDIANAGGNPINLGANLVKDLNPVNAVGDAAKAIAGIF